MLDLFSNTTVNRDIAIACRQFSKNSTNNYGDRNQSDQRKVEWDAFIGKVGEWIAYERLKTLPVFKDLSCPDMKIYPIGQKGWDNDLYNNDLKVAVKSCANNNLSWVFQLKDIRGKGTDKEIYGESVEDKLVVCVHVMLTQPMEGESLKLPIQGCVKSLMTLKQIRQLNLLEPMRLEKFHGLKEAVYYFSASYYGFGSGQIHQSVEKLIKSKTER